jgi:hypothetical protein
MAKKVKKQKPLRILVPLLIIFLGLIAYFFLLKPGNIPAPISPTPSETTTAREVHRQPVQPSEPSSLEREDTLAEADTSSLQEAEEDMQEQIVEEDEDTCEEIEEGARDFFRYINECEYAERVKGDKDTWDLFANAMRKLSANPPASAGEGLDPAVMTKNIFHFFRTLDDRQIILAREIIQNEADTLELNLELFYRWLTISECPDPDGIRPSSEVLYKYAGFFMNTIGGRSYLFRRDMRLRLLISYYSILILHEADERGENRDGIDILPLVREVGYGMEIQPGLHFRDSYLNRLTDIEAYYNSRR